MLLFTFSKVIGDYIVGSWATAEDQHSRYAYYCFFYYFFTLFTSFMVFCRFGSLAYFSWYGSEKLHKAMIKRVLNAPVNLYFDTTPTGLILNRFSKDLTTFDNECIYFIGSSLVSFYTLIAILVIAIFISPWIAIFFPILIFLVIRVYISSIAATKEVTRIESVTKSPLLSFLGETISGCSTIRAFNKKEEFIE